DKISSREQEELKNSFGRLFGFSTNINIPNSTQKQNIQQIASLSFDRMNGCDKEVFFDSARKYAEKYHRLSLFIHDFGFNEQQRVEIAKIAAAHQGESLSELIENYRIEDENARFEIAKIAASFMCPDELENKGGISRYIKNYHLNDNNRFE